MFSSRYDDAIQEQENEWSLSSDISVIAATVIALSRGLFRNVVSSNTKPMLHEVVSYEVVESYELRSHLNDIFFLTQEPDLQESSGASVNLDREEGPSF